MYDTIEYAKLDKNYILIDLRTKEEYEEFHIPNSTNIPILEYDERKEIGILYNNNEKDVAKSKAIMFASKKLNIIHQFILYNKAKKIVFYCARGGFRSKTVSSLFFSLGYHVCQLKGGIKSYRNYINKNLDDLINNSSFITIYGHTGCGKTDLLKLLKNKFPTIDLEGMANHRGSVLGSIGLGKINSQKMFEALLFEKLKSNEGSCFLIEGESKKIGKLFLPETLWQKMQNSFKIYIDSPIDFRIKRLLNLYVFDNKKELLNSIKYIQKYISKENFETIKNSIENEDYYNAAKILCEKYYDNNYKFKPDEKCKIFINTDDNKCACEIFEFLKKYKPKQNA